MIVFPAPRRLLIVIAALAVPTVTHGEGRKKFDLFCSGTVSSKGFDDVQSQERFEDRFSADLATMRFCDKFSCDALATADREALTYNCVVTKESRRFCASGTIQTTSGPFVLRDAFTFTRANGKFSRTMSGEIGDRTSVPYAAKFDGTCVIASYSGVKPD